MQQIVAYRSQNELPQIEEMDAVIENYLCGLPEHQGDCRKYKVLKRGFLSFIKGGVALLKNMAYDSFAPQSVADTRSFQCRECPNNTFPDKGAFIKWSDEIAVASVGSRRSSCHNSLGSCSVCDCPLRAKVFYNRSDLTFTEPQLEALREVNCWQLSLLKDKPND